jgi:hypothetical protein
MARQCSPAAPHEKPETVVEPGRKPLYPKGGAARCCKLNCQRDTVEVTTNSGNRGRNACVSRKVWRGRVCPLDEQPDGAVAKRVFAIRANFWGDSKWRHQVNPLALCPECLAAGGDHVRCRAGAQQ